LNAIILSAGIGSRLNPLTNYIPKTLVRVANKPIIQYQIEALLNNRVENIIVCVGYKGNLVKEFCQKKFQGKKIIFVNNKNYNSTNNMYSLWLAKDYLTDDCFILNGDVIFDKEIIGGMQALKNSSVAIDIGTYNDESMKVQVNSGNRIIDISKKIEKNKAFGCSIDIYRFTKEDALLIKKELINYIEKEKRVNEWTEVLLQKLFKNRKVNPEVYDIKKLKWIEIDDYNDLNKAELMFNNKILNLSNKEIFFLDRDGTLLIDENEISGAKKFISTLIKKHKLFYVLTNNSSKTRGEHYKIFKKAGFDFSENNILVSTDSLIKYLKKKFICKIYLIANKTVSEYFRKAGFILTNKNPQAVVLTYDNEITYEKLKEFVFLLNKGIPYYATHTDIVCPTVSGFVPDIGTFIKVIEMTTGKKPLKTFGKPSKDMILPILINHQLEIDDAVIIGDRLYTDMELARNVGCDFICVLSGEAKHEEIENLKHSPDLIVEDIGKLVDYL
jgi:HAD superfamily hydrolase (TIGR01450 family)